LVKWCLRGFEVSDKYREQRHFSRLVHDDTVIGNISEIVITVGYSSLLIKKFGNYIISLLYLIPFMIIFSVKEWRDLETGGTGCSRSSKMAPFDPPLLA